MIPYALDPSLHATAPEPPQLEDGFSPPPDGPQDAQAALPIAGTSVTIDPSLQDKSLF